MLDRIPVLLDTDIGSDIDDALCLAYLLRQPRCELVGITTVTGEPEKRAMLADAICQADGRTDIPIVSGCGNAMLGPTMQSRCPQAEILERWKHRRYSSDYRAVEFMRQTIHSRPGEIVLLAVGPLTNVGLLLAIDPEIPALLRSIVLMCGVFKQGGPGAREWNAKLDPEATALVYRAAAPTHISIGLDVTRRCVLPAAECRRRLVGGSLSVAADAAEVWFRQCEHITFHDPLAAAVIFEPSLCEYEDGKVAVETHSEELRGMTLWHPGVFSA